MPGVCRTEAANALQLSASIAAVKPLRYTPAGLPALDLQLEHGSRQPELGGLRTVQLVISAVAFGAVAERLAVQAIGSVWSFKGFIANASHAGRQGKSVVFHIQEFVQD